MGVYCLGDTLAITLTILLTSMGIPRIRQGKYLNSIPPVRVAAEKLQKNKKPPELKSGGWEI